MGPQRLQFLPSDGIRPAGLHRVLGAFLQGETFPAPGQQPVQLVCAQGGRCAAAHIEGAHRQSSFPQDSARLFYFLQKSRHIGFHQIQGPVYPGGDKRAVGAPGRAEGDANVEGDFFGAQGPQGLYAGFGAVHSQGGPLRADEVILFQRLLGLLRGLAFQHGSGGQLHRADARQCPPRRRTAQKCDARFVKGNFQGVLNGVIDLLRRAVQFFGGKAGDTIIISGRTEDQNTEICQLFPPVKGKYCRIVLPAHVPGEGSIRVFWFFPWKQREHHLFGGVVIPLRGPREIGGLKIQLHGIRPRVSLRPIR